MRRHRPLLRTTALFAVALLLAGCMTTNLPPISVVGGSFQPLPDELELWDSARGEEEKLLDKVVLYDDPQLEDYLEDVVERLNPPGMAANRELRYQVRVIEDPTLNAFAYPHGSLYVHTGLLARMENEDQLATVLGHEMTHVENRHMVRYQRSIHNKEVAITAIAVAAAVYAAGKESDAWYDGDWGKAARIGVLSELLIGLGLELAFLASVNGYGRDLELEADQGGFTKLERAGYDLAEAPRVYEILADDHGDNSQMEVFFFGSHPNLTQRVQSAKTYLKAHPAQAETRQASLEQPGEFEKRLRPVLRDDARLNIENGRLELAQDQLERALALMPTDPETHVQLARLRQAEAVQSPAEAPALLAQARGEYLQAIELDPGRPEPHRELGLLAHGAKDYRQACQSFGRYLDLAPGADDSARIHDYLAELRQGDSCP